MKKKFKDCLYCQNEALALRLDEIERVAISNSKDFDYIIYMLKERDKRKLDHYGVHLTVNG